jgi:hypothetical protein
MHSAKYHRTTISQSRLNASLNLVNQGSALVTTISAINDQARWFDDASWPMVIKIVITIKFSCFNDLHLLHVWFVGCCMLYWWDCSPMAAVLEQRQPPWLRIDATTCMVDESSPPALFLPPSSPPPPHIMPGCSPFLAAQWSIWCRGYQARWILCWLGCSSSPYQRLSPISWYWPYISLAEILGHYCWTTNDVTVQQWLLRLGSMWNGIKTHFTKTKSLRLFICCGCEHYLPS